MVSTKKTVKIKKVELGDVNEEVLVFRDKFEAFRHYGVGSMEQLAEALGREFHGQSLEELLNG